MSYNETLKILNKPWVSSTDIQVLLNCGKESARKIRNDVSKKIIDKGYMLPVGKTKVISTKELVEYLGLDMNYIIDMAKLEETK